MSTKNHRLSLQNHQKNAEILVYFSLIELLIFFRYHQFLCLFFRFKIVDKIFPVDFPLSKVHNIITKYVYRFIN